MHEGQPRRSRCYRPVLTMYPFRTPCKILGQVTIPLLCKGGSYGNCPGQDTGQQVLATYECCLVLDGWVLCVSSTVVLTACP